MGMLSFSVTKGTACHIQDLRYLKVHMRGIRWSSTVKHKTERKAVSSELLACLEAERERETLTQTVTVDESWVHHFELETKVQSMD
jgi:hypothetical protein